MSQYTYRAVHSATDLTVTLVSPFQCLGIAPQLDNMSYRPPCWAPHFRNLCHDAGGYNFCDCQMHQGQSPDQCRYYGRSAEPLAFTLSNQPTLEQELCPLFAILPSEIRHLVYDYAFTDCTSHPPNRDNVYRRYPPTGRDTLPSSDIAFALLQTCRTIYLEAYRLPLLLNHFIVYDFQRHNRPPLSILAPWQFALISRLDISLQQIALERGELRNYLLRWRAGERHAGQYVVPRCYSAHIPLRRYPAQAESFNFGLIERSRMTHEVLEDGTEIDLDIGTGFYEKHRLWPTNMPARAMVARPLTHLTLRLSRTDWWSWSDHPDTINDYQQLGLDPARGNGANEEQYRPSLMMMQELAARRQAGEHSRYRETWGAVVGKLPDLKVLELVLETFGDKKHQLEIVAECAKTWRFPLEDTLYELVWGGEIKDASWKGDATEFEDPDERRLREIPRDEDHEEDENDDYEFDRESDEEEDDDYFPDCIENDAQPEESWVDRCTQFEVRVVRFTRQKRQ